MKGKEYTLEELLGLNYKGSEPVKVRCITEGNIRFIAGKHYEVRIEHHQNPRIYTEGGNVLYREHVLTTVTGSAFKFVVIDTHRIESKNESLDDAIDSVSEALKTFDPKNIQYNIGGRTFTQSSTKPFFTEKEKDMENIIDTLNNTKREHFTQPVSVTKNMTLDLGTVLAENATIKGLKLGENAIVTRFSIVDSKIHLQLEEGDVITNVDASDDSIV